MISESGYPAVGGGGLEYQITTISKGLLNRDVKVKIIAPMVSYVSQKRRDRHEGIDIYRIPYPKLPYIGAMMLLLSLARYLIKHREEYIALHCHAAHNTAAIGCIVGKIVGKPVVVKLTGWWERNCGILKEEKYNFHVRFLRWATKKATYYQTISNQLAILLEKKGYEEKKIILLPNAVNTDRFFPNSKREISKATTHYNFKLLGLFVGRLVPEKGLDMLLEAWVKAFNTDDNAGLIIVGEGELDQKLKNKVKLYGRTHQIFLPGPTENVEQYLNIANYGVLPSLYEGLSNTLLEYMSSGLPVIGSRISGTEDVIAHSKNGWLYTSGNTRELIQCLIELKNKNAKELNRMGELGRAFVKQYAGIDSIVEKLSQLYGINN